jgi:hypothetical protein
MAPRFHSDAARQHCARGASGWQRNGYVCATEAANSKDSNMAHLNQIRDALRRRAEYNRVRSEIARMPIDVALDLDIYPGDADRIARQAVYGR